MQVNITFQVGLPMDGRRADMNNVIEYIYDHIRTFNERDTLASIDAKVCFQNIVKVEIVK